MDTKRLPNLPNRSLSASPRVQSMPYRQTSNSPDLSLPSQPNPATLTPPSSLYDENRLHSFSFGTQPAYVPPPSIDPLSQEDDPDPRRVDITPRPSVVDYGPFGGTSDRIFGNQMPGMSRRDGPHSSDATELDARLFSPDPARARASDAASHRTFGTSSASASVTSLSSVGQHTSDQSASTRHTSAANTDDEGEDRRQLDFSSDDDYEDDYYEDDEDDPAYRVEISSAIYEENGESSAFTGSTNLAGQNRIDPSYDRRRGSLPMAIPGTTLEWRSDDRGRDREDSLITLRRPSRSLDDDLSILSHYSSAATSGGAGTGSTSVEPLAHSVPGSETDWRNLAHKRRMNPARGSVSTSSTVRDTAYSSITPTSSRVNGSSATDGFDPDWLEMMRGGITSVPTSDFVQSQDPLSAGRSSLFGLRRPSMASSVMTYDDPFLKAVGRWDLHGYGVQRQEWTFKRETADGSGPYQAIKPPTTGNKLAALWGSKPTERDRVGLSSITSSRSITAEENEKRERQRERERRSPSNWKGMAIGAGEVWGNLLIGRYEIKRTTSTPSDPNKGPQQRLAIMHFSDDRTRLRHKSPPVTVHKHSKAIAYSISRFYRLRVQHPQEDSYFKATATRDTGYSRPPPSRDGSVATSKTSTPYARPKGSATMILLAPRRVQEDYTNTTTTRKLEHHGLLDEQSRRPRDKSLTRREDKGRDRDKKRRSEGSKKAKPSKKDAAKMEREQVSSSGSIASTSSSLAPSASSLISQDRRSRRRRSPGSSSDEDNVSYRTPHSETYSTVDPAVLDQLRPNRANAANDESGLLKRIFGGTKSQTNSIGGSGNFNPPWIVMSSRNEQEEQQRMVRNLSSSFAGVGLLPPTNKERSRSNSERQRRNDGSDTIDIFDEIEPDTLFMILPLWPGETDPKSRSKVYARAEIPLQDRLFLILSYQTNKQKSPQDGKKVRSPTSSAENRDDRNILLAAFYISARVVKYHELMGSGMRVPDEGLAVSGPLEDAFRNIPKPDTGMQIIGNCSSRESGIEFDPEGLACLGLSNPPPPDMPNDGVPMVTIPTPIGRAVMEMAFIGGIALTSFGSITS